MRSFNLSDLSDNALSSWSRPDIFLEYSLALFLQLVELFEFSFTFFYNE